MIIEDVTVCDATDPEAVIVEQTVVRHPRASNAVRIDHGAAPDASDFYRAVVKYLCHRGSGEGSEPETWQNHGA